MADDGLKEGAQHNPHGYGAKSGKPSGSQLTPKPKWVEANPRTGTDQYSGDIQLGRGKTVSTQKPRKK